jgi:hypothetical protein
MCLFSILLISYLEYIGIPTSGIGIEQHMYVQQFIDVLVQYSPNILSRIHRYTLYLYNYLHSAWKCSTHN